MNNETSQNNSLKESIFKKIETGEVSMRPKAYFAVEVALLVFIAFITFVVSVFLVSYTLFYIRTGGELFLLGFGFKGFYRFIVIFPWLILCIDALLLVFLDWLLKRFRFGYHSPIIYLFLGTLAIITVFGSLLNLTPFHQDLMHRAEKNRLPMAGGFYEGLRKSHGKVGIFRGEVSLISGNTFTLKYDDYDTPGEDGSLVVIAPPGVVVELLLEPGDEVFVAGDLVNGQIQAYGIRKLTTDE